MNNFSQLLKPQVAIYGLNTYLGKNLADYLTKQSVKVVPFEALALKNSRARVVFIKEETTDPITQSQNLKELIQNTIAKIVLVTSLDCDPTDLFLEKVLQDHGQDKIWQIIRVPKIYGPGAPVGSLGILGHYFKNILSCEPLKIPGEGLTKTPYLYITDAATAICKVTLMDDLTRGVIFPLRPSEIVSEVELAYLLKALNKEDLKVEFQSRYLEEESSKVAYGDHKLLENLRLINFSPQVPLREGLRETLKVVAEPARPQRTKETITKLVPSEVVAHNSRPQKATRPKKRSTTFATLGIVVALVVATGLTFWYPLARTAYYGLKGKQALENTIQELSNLKVLGAMTQANTAEESLKKALDSSQKLPRLAITSRAEQYLQGGMYLASALNSLTTIAAGITGGNTSPQVLSAAAPQIKEAANNLQLAKLELGDTLMTSGVSLGQVSDSLNLISQIYPALPSILGFDKPKTYLILFQNPMELRATGGFIGSYAKVTISNGQIGTITFDDIYNPDGKLQEKGLGAPVPPDMKVAFPTFSKLYIRDANWWVSYPESARNIASLYKMATGEEISGVIAIDLDLVRSVMAITGPIYLGSYDKTVSSGNLFETLQYQSETNYFDGSPQKKNFLQLLGNKLLEKINAESASEKLKLLPLLGKALQEKHLLVSIFDSAAGSILAENGWDGRIIPPSGSDYLMVVDTNNGGNKANYFVRRSINYEVKNTYREGTLEGFLNISYQNTSDNGTWPSGPYKNYVRILVPRDSFLNDASTEKVNSSDQTATIPTVTVGTDNGLTVFSYGFELPAGQSLTLKLHYTLPGELSLKPAVKSYDLQVVKQPGTEGDPFMFKFYAPFGRQLSIPENFKLDKDGITYQTTLKSDINLQIPIN